MSANETGAPAPDDRPPNGGDPPPPAAPYEQDLESGAGQPPQCPDAPLAFFGRIEPWAEQFHAWAREVDRSGDSCYEKKCSSNDRRRELRRLCRDFNRWARDVTRWADEVENCFLEKCPPFGHTKPPRPPFRD